MDETLAILRNSERPNSETHYKLNLYAEEEILHDNKAHFLRSDSSALEQPLGYGHGSCWAWRELYARFAFHERRVHHLRPEFCQYLPEAFLPSTGIYEAGNATPLRDVVRLIRDRRA